MDSIIINPEIKRIIEKFFIASRAERKDVLQDSISKALSELASKGMLSSNVAINKISKVYADEIKIRFGFAWDSIKKIFDKQKISLSKEKASEVEDLIKQLVNNEIENLSKGINSRFLQRQGPLDFKNSILIAIASARNTIFPKLSAELNYFITEAAGIEMKSSKKEDNEYNDDPRRSLKSKAKPSIDPKKLFVVHGRNLSARDAIFQFLRAIGLKPIEWSQATAMSQKGAPYVGEILDAAFSEAQAVLVLITGDDEAKLRKEFLNEGDPIYEKESTIQSRPNVLFEAGMAFGSHQDRTVLVEIEKTRPFSDIAGRYIVRLDNSTEKRQELAQCLKNAGCDVDLTGTAWHKAGDFKKCIFSFNKSPEPELEYKPPFYYRSGDSVPYCPICWESDRKQIHLNGPHDIPGEQPFYKCLKCDNNF